MTPDQIILLIGALSSAGLLDVAFSWLPDSITKYKGFLLKILAGLNFKTPKKMYNAGREDKI